LTLALAAGCAHSSGGASGELDKPALIRGMQPVREPAHACFERLKVPGRVDVAVEIAPDGRVVAAEAVGEFAHSKTGDCIAAAMKASATFPRFKGPRMRTRWPIILQ